MCFLEIFLYIITEIIYIAGDHTTGVWVGGSDNGHIGRWAWFPTGKGNVIYYKFQAYNKI